MKVMKIMKLVKLVMRVKISKKIEYKKIDMKQINVLYNNINNSSFNFVIIDGNKCEIKKVLDFLKNIKYGCYNDNNIIKFYKKDGIDKVKCALYKARKKSVSIKKFSNYMHKLDNILFTPISNSQKILEVGLKLMKQDLVKIKKEKDTSIYLLLYLKYILIIVQKN